MNYELTILVPAIRTDRWAKLYESAKLSCKNYKFEILFVSPFELPEELKDNPDIRVLHSKSNVTMSVQKGVPQCRAPLFFLTVDDCTFAEDAIDAAMDLYFANQDELDTTRHKKLIISMIYGEGGNLMNPNYWTTGFHSVFQTLHGVDKSWKLANQCIMEVCLFTYLGGLDCIFEYLDSAIHDLMFRAQLDGAQILHSPKHTCIATWYPGEMADHSPIHHAQTDHDQPIFNAMWSQPGRRIRIDINNYQQYPDVWARRFTKGVPSSYQELIKQEGYIMP